MPDQELDAAIRLKAALAEEQAAKRVLVEPEATVRQDLRGAAARWVRATVEVEEAREHAAEVFGVALPGVTEALVRDMITRPQEHDLFPSSEHDLAG